MLYVSLTCLPTRIDNINEVLKSIMNQTIQPDKIIINYPEKCLRLNVKYDCNLFKTKIDSNNEVSDEFKEKIIINNTKDYGPITKIYPTLLLDFVKKDDIIIVIDDDIYYNPYLIEYLYDDFIKYGKSCAHSVSGLMYPKTLNSDYQCCRPGSGCELMEAAFGYIVSAGFFKTDIKDWIIEATTFKEVKANNYLNSFLEDDFVISKYLEKNGIPKKVIDFTPLINKSNCLMKNEFIKSTDALCGLGHNLDTCVKSNIELKIRNLL